MSRAARSVTGAPAFRIKRLIDDAQHWACMKSLCDEWSGFSDGEMARGLLDLEVSALRLNDLVLAGWQGESMIDTCLWLRAQSLGDRLVVLDQINGYTSYMNTLEQYDQGGYSYWGGALARTSERILRQRALDAIRQAWER